jgi:endoglucanase
VVTDSGDAFTIKAVNWFGMETSTCAPHGLWQRGMDSILDQIASWGFNTIRLPYANQCIEGGAPNSIDYSLNPELAGKDALQVMDAVVAGAGARGLRVILDQHRPGYGSQSPLWYTDEYPESAWIADWVSLATRYRDDPTVIGADLHNEPAGAACWGCGTPAVDWATAATRAGDAVLAVNPHLLVIVEGVQNQAAAPPTWQGGGLADVAKHPISLSVEHRLVYSAHDYPASVYPQPWFSAPDYPANLASIWDANFGYIQREGIAPVFIGEFGTRLQTASDRQWLGTLVEYLRAHGFGFAFWSYNPDSGDTGGLVADDWTTPETAKLDALAPLLGSAPPSGAPSAVPAAPSAAPRPRATPSAGPSRGSPLVVSWALQSSWADGYVAELTISAQTAVRSWTITWPDSFARSVSSSWGMTCAVGDAAVSCTGSDWGADLSAGQSITVGLQVAGVGVVAAHPQLTVEAD